MDGIGNLLEIGSKFGDYTVVERLGKGAMGEVYRITNGETDFAVKIMSSDSATSEKSRHEWRRRFAREAEVAMKIRHKNLVEVYDVGEDPQTGLCYIIMEYVGGGTLSDLLRRKGKLDIREAIAITMHIANALGVAHRHGVVHRDIKPDNIMFTGDGTPKLADLGIARVKNDDEDETTITKTNMMVGTPAYMAPEQMVNSHDVDARADIYSLGVVLYEMLAGKRPNAGSTVVELLAKALKGEELPDVRKLRPEVSAALSYALSRMVANKMENRPASAEEAARLVYDAALGKIVARAPSRALASGRALGGGPRRHFWPIAFCAASLAAVLSFLHSWRTSGGESSRVVAPVVTNMVSVVTNVSSVVTNVVAVAANAAPVAADAVPSRAPSVGEKPKGEPLGEREVPLADVPQEFRNDLEALQKRYEKRVSRNTRGRLVFGRLDVEGGSADDVATWAWLNRDGTFTAAAVMAVRNGLVFLKNGYEPLVVKVEDADKPWRDDTALNLGTVRMKKLPEGKTATASMTIRLPEGVEGGSLEFMLVNNSPCGLDWGTYGREKNYRRIAKVSFRNGERVTIAGCAPTHHLLLLTAPGCPKFNQPPRAPLSSGENYLGEFSLMRTKTAAFAVRPYGEKGGAWKRSNVNVDGDTPLLLLDRKDKSGNACRLHLNAYGDSGKSVFGHFGWGSTTCEDLGEMTVEELERRERAGGLHPPDDKKRDFKLVPGHVYRIKNDWHWQMDLLVAFESYYEAPQMDKPAPKPNMETGSPDVRVAEVDGQSWFYKLEGGNAVLVARNLQGGFSPCVEPAPAGRVVVPAALDGHNVTVLDNLAFLNCSGMTEIVLPECLEEIREWKTFYRCESLREITLPPKLRKMGVWTFEKCRSLRRVNLMNCEVTHSGFGCLFKDCTSLEEILCSRKNKAVVSVNGALYSKDKRTLLAYPKTQKEIRLLPSTRNIANSALVSLPIRRVKIPNGIEFVDACNFEYDEEGVVQSVEFPKSLKSLGDRIFKGTSRVKTVIFNGNAPELPKGSPFAESDADFTVEVRRNSKGWIRYGSSKLPEKWPVGDPNAMPIRHIDGK